MNKILFVSANRYQDPYPVYPLGVSYLATCLRTQLPQYDTQIFDFNLHSSEEFTTLITATPYKYICVSLRNIDDTNIFEKNSFISWYLQIIEMIKQHSPNSIIIIGGAGFSVFPELLFKVLQPNYGINGEGEDSIVQLITTLDKQEQPNEIEGLVYMEGEKTIVNPRTHYCHSIALHVEDDLIDFYWNKSGMLNVQTKRGCPHKCIYCSYPVIEGRTIRTLDPQTVVENLKELYFGKNINYTFFTDSVFNIDKTYNKELCERIIDSGIKVNWGAYFSPKGLNKDDWSLYKKAGLTHVEFGTESFSDTQLKNYGKNFTFSDVEAQSKLCADLGIFYAHFLILGGYGETPKTLSETFENSKKVGMTVLFPYIGMRIYPHTKLCEIAIHEGVIKSEEELINPVYYVSDKIDVTNIELQAHATGQKWVFPNDETDAMMARFRAKKRRGPLWEYLRY